MHTNHRHTRLKRKKRNKYKYDMRSLKPPKDWAYFRAAEQECFNRILQEEDPDDIIWPTKLKHIPIYNPRSYD